MARTFTSKSGRTFQHTSPDADLGIRLGVNVARIAAERDLSPRGAVLRLAAGLALYGQERFKAQTGAYRSAPLTAQTVQNPDRVKPTLLLDHLEDSDRFWNAQDHKDPHAATVTAMIEALRDGGNLDDAAEILRNAVNPRSHTAAATRADLRRKDRAAHEARKRSAKAK